MTSYQYFIYVRAIILLKFLQTNNLLRYAVVPSLLVQHTFIPKHIDGFLSILDLWSDYNITSIPVRQAISCDMQWSLRCLYSILNSSLLTYHQLNLSSDVSVIFISQTLSWQTVSKPQLMANEQHSILKFDAKFFTFQI